MSKYYTITEEKQAFILARDDGRTTCRVYVIYSPGDGQFLISLIDGVEHGRAGQVPSPMAVDMYNFAGLIHFIVHHLRNNWTRPPDQEMALWRFDQWLTRTLSRSISRMVRDQWWRLLTAHVAPDVLALSRALFAASGSGRATLYQRHPLLLPELEFVRRDLLAYRGAAFVIGLMMESATTYYSGGEVQHPHNDPLAYYGNWRGWLSDNAKPYRALNRTLDGWPGGVRRQFAYHLRSTHLEHPITERSTLIMTMALSEHYGRQRIQFQGHQVRNAIHQLDHIAQHSTPAHITKAVRLYCARMHEEYSWKATTIAEAGWYIGDWVVQVPDIVLPDNISVVGLMERAIAWHREVEANRIRRYAAELADTTPTALPPIPLPQIEGIRFLATAGEIVAEGAEMRHCVAGYAPLAVEGRCYLFHVEYREEFATVEIAPNGEVRQSRGPRNHINKASEYGKAKLAAWGSRLRAHLDEKSAIGRLYFNPVV